MASRFPLTRQLSAGAVVENACFLCLGTVGCEREDSSSSASSVREVAPKIGDLRLGCRCGVHYECLISYIRSSLQDRSVLKSETVSIKRPITSDEEDADSASTDDVKPRIDVRIGGLSCPYGGACRLFAQKQPGESVLEEPGTPTTPTSPSSSSTQVYYITAEDMDNIAEYGMPETTDESGESKTKSLNPILLRRLEDINCKALTHEEVASIRSWIEETSEKQINSSDFDPYVLATTKACPTCSFPSSHYHGHQCHYISPPPTRGCPNCHVGYCYKCLSTEVQNLTDRGSKDKCKCGFSHTFCSPIKTADDIANFLIINEYGIPLDKRCGCVICVDCRNKKPCRFCPGDCAVCRGFINPGPSEINKNTPWHPTKKLVAVLSGNPKLDLWACCRAGDVPGLVAAVESIKTSRPSGTTADGGGGSGGGGADDPDIKTKLAEILNSVDNNKRSPLFMAVDANQADAVKELLTRYGDIIDPNIAVPIATACEGERDRSMIDMLLAHPKLDINKSDRGGFTALYKACFLNLPDITVKFLAHSQIDVNKVSLLGEPLYLYFCCSQMHNEIAIQLLNHPNIDVNQATRYGNPGNQTALMKACETDNLELVGHLVRHPKIDLTIKDDLGQTAVDYIDKSKPNAVAIALLIGANRPRGTGGDSKVDSSSSSGAGCGAKVGTSDKKNCILS